MQSSNLDNRPVVCYYINIQIFKAIMDFKRARKAEQIEERKLEILTLTKELCKEKGIMGWSLNELGRRCKISKSNIYRYFGSREEVLLTLFASEMKKFVQDLESHTTETDIENFSKIVAQTYRNHSFFCDLLCLSSTILEHNIDINPIIDIKRSMISLIEPHASSFEKALAWISKEQAIAVSQSIAIYASGLWPLANPAAVINEITKLEEFKCIKFDFETQMQHFIKTILTGLKNQNQ